MVPVVCIVGASDVGKTTFLEKLIPELTSRGYRIGTIKHDVHGFEMDREGKDTWRLRQAGAAAVAISSPSLAAVIRQTGRELDLAELATRFFWQEDLVLTEGYKRSHFPKIEVFRAAVEPKPLCGPADNLIAVVSDDPVEVEVPVFGSGQVAAAVDFIVERYLAGRRKHAVQVLLDGKKLPMNDFVRDIVAGGLCGMLEELRGWNNPKHIAVDIRREDE